MIVSFGRAIKIGNYNEYSSRKISKSTKETINTIKEDKSSIYDKETSRKIGKFLREQIGDYNEETGIYMKKIDRDVYLYTGKEAKKACDISKGARKRKAAVNHDYENGRISKKSRKTGLQDIETECNEKLLQLVENGYKGKPQTNLFNKHHW